MPEKWETKFIISSSDHHTTEDCLVHETLTCAVPFCSALKRARVSRKTNEEANPVAKPLIAECELLLPKLLLFLIECLCGGSTSRE